jgi:hypothetical protein
MHVEMACCNQPKTTTVIRYLYLVHGDWFHSKIPDLRVQRFLAISLDLVTTCLLFVPILGTAIFFGNFLIVFSYSKIFLKV